MIVDSMDQLRANVKDDADGSENPQPAIALIFLHFLNQTLPQFATPTRGDNSSNMMQTNVFVKFYGCLPMK
jgi:hypothetical protein